MYAPESTFVKVEKTVRGKETNPPLPSRYPPSVATSADATEWLVDEVPLAQKRASCPTDVAIFDFDRTLISSSSLVPVLYALAGFRRIVLGCIVAGGTAAVARRKSRADVFRSTLLRSMVAGRTIADLESAAERAFPLLRWRDEILHEYAEHRRAGRAILVASGSIACCVRRLLALKRLDIDGLLATDLIEVDGALTGAIDGLACTGWEKARRVKEWLGDAPRTIWGYGNLPSDGPMLSLAHHPSCVDTRGVRRMAP